MTGQMMIAIKKFLLRERTDCLLVYGDTNSILAVALTAAKAGAWFSQSFAGRAGRVSGERMPGGLCC